jgi:hypothetical protein
MNRPHSLRATRQVVRAAAALTVAALAAASGVRAAEPTLAELQRQLAQMQTALQQLADENRALREHQAQVDRKLVELSGAAPAAVAQAPLAGTASATAGQPNGSALPSVSPPPTGAVPNASALPSTAALSPTATAEPGTTGPGLFGTGLRLWGYGEVYYTRPINEPAQTTMDLARAVFGIGYKFSDRTEFNSEYEVEHAVSSASDVGEFEVEQFYVDHRVSDGVTVRAGLFLMPFGFLNEHHEPTNFYGVQRNFVETLIIPSTWREGGFNLHGETASGFGWNVGLTTGFDLSKWDFQPEFPPYRTALELENSGIAPLQASHQELALANARHLSQYVALNYYGIPGLSIGGAVSSGKAVPAGPGDPRVTLWEAHARWAPGPFEFSALYARGTISDLASTNELFPGSPNPIPSAFYGYYLEAAWQAWEHGDYRLAPFARFERYDLGASWAGTSGPDIPSGLVPMSPAPGDFGYWPKDQDRVWTVGANFYITPHVVLKADYQWFEENSNFKRYDLGLGVAF